MAKCKRLPSRFTSPLLPALKCGPRPTARNNSRYAVALREKQRLDWERRAMAHAQVHGAHHGLRRIPKCNYQTRIEIQLGLASVPSPQKQAHGTRTHTRTCCVPCRLRLSRPCPRRPPAGCQPSRSAVRPAGIRPWRSLNNVRRRLPNLSVRNY